MTEAKLTRIVPDALLASTFLRQAQTLLEDAGDEGISSSGRQLLLHAAAIAACDAILTASGFEVEGTERGHLLRLRKAEELLGGGRADLFERLEEVRLTRAEVSYRAGFVPPADVAEGVAAVRRLAEEADRYVTSR